MRRMRLVLLTTVLTAAAYGGGFRIASTAANGLPVAAEQAPPRPTTSAVLSNGGGPPGGVVWSLAASSGRADVLYASFIGGGVFNTVDAGASWTEIDRGLPLASSSTCTLAVHPHDAAVTYAECGRQLFRTLNGGRDWVRFVAPALPRIAIADPRTLYTLVNDVANRFRLFSSRDGGGTWKRMGGHGAPDTQVSALAIDPRNALVLYASGEKVGIWTSRDGGDHWSQVAGGLPVDAYVIALTVDAFDSERVYAGTMSKGLFATRSGGRVWTRIGEGLATGPVRSIRCDGSSKGTLYAQVDAARQVFRSDDFGMHWTPIDGGLESLSVFDLATGSSVPLALYAATNGGVFRTVDGGQHWMGRSAGIARMSVRRLAWSEGGRPEVLAQAERATFRSGNLGRTWELLPDPSSLDRPDVLTLWSDGGGTVLGETKSGMFERERATGAWVPFGASGPNGRTRSLWLSPRDPSVMYAATDDGLAITVDRGRTWTATTLPDGLVPAHLAIAPHQPDLVLASAASLAQRDGLWRSSDGGRHWVQVLEKVGPIVNYHRRSIRTTPRQPMSWSIGGRFITRGA